MSENPDNGQQPNMDTQDQGEVQAAVSVDPRQQLLDIDTKYIVDLPRTIHECSPFQIVLLTNNNGAIQLDPPRPTHPPTINVAPGQAQVVESQYRSGNYINA
jgi:hypothetical protein